MNYKEVVCFLGLHKWRYTFEGIGRRCQNCQKKQEHVAGLGWDGWVDIPPVIKSPKKVPPAPPKVKNNARFDR